MVAVLGEEHAFDPIHCPAAHSDALASLKKRIRSPRRGLGHDPPDTFNLFIWNRHASAAGTDKAVDTLYTVDPRTILRSQSAADEHVAVEQWHFDFLFAIAPAVNFDRGSKKSFHAFIAQAPLNSSFVARLGVQGIPAHRFRFLRCPLGEPGACFRNLIDAADIGTTHSFALWVPFLNGSAWPQQKAQAFINTSSGRKTATN